MIKTKGQTETWVKLENTKPNVSLGGDDNEGDGEAKEPEQENRSDDDRPSEKSTLPTSTVG